MKLEIFQGRSGLEALESEWRELSEKTSTSSLTQLVEYFYAYVTAFEHADRELIIAAVRNSNERLVALAPLRTGEKKMPGTRMRYLEFANVPVPIRDIVYDSACRGSRIVEFLVESLAAQFEDRCDYVHFRGVPAGSLLLAPQDAASIRRSVIEQIGISHLLDISTPGYIDAALSTNARNNLRRNKKKLKKLGDFQFRTFSNLPELETAYEQFLTTEAAGWKSVRGGKRAVKLHADQTRFYDDLMTRLAKAGQIHIHLLYVQDQPVASDYCVISGERVFSLKHGFDEAYSNIAPGNLLRAYTIEYYHKLGSINCIDLISGWDWQRRWRPERRAVFDIKIFSRSWRGSLLYYLARLRQIKKKKSQRG